MFLGIDIGTSAVKALIMQPDGGIAASATCPLTVQSPHPLWSEQDPNAWTQAVLTACEGLRQDNPDAYRTVRAIGLSGQMHGAVCLDGDRRPVRPAILWNDGRSHAECALLRDRRPDIGLIAGVPPMPGFTAPKLLWMARNEPDLHARIRHVILPKDYVRLFLTGTLATDMADAAGTLWLDQEKRAWSPALCEISETDPDWLPDCLEGTAASGTLTGDAASKLDLQPGLPVAAGGGDAATGAMGIGAVNDGDAFLSLGTSGQLFVSTDTYRPNPESAVHAFAHCVPDRWFQMAAMLNGASPLDWYARLVGRPIADLLSEAAADKNARIPLFLPYLTGERTPHNDPHIRAGFYGMDPATGQAAMTQAVLDGIAYTFCDALDALTSAGTSIRRPAAIGGGARGDLLLQTLSDALGLEILRYRDAETGPAYGAARLAVLAVGAASLDDIATAPAVDRIFEPDTSTRTYHRDRLGQFRALYKALKTISD
ncbi:MAG: xylulokinase [Pseudomonadota bacterium]